MSFFIFLLFGGFIYLFSRINKIEKLLNVYKKESAGLKPAELSVEIPKTAEEAKEDASQWEIISPQQKITEPPASEPQENKVAEISPKPEKTFDSDLEFKLGSRIATGIGALAVIIGIGFFLRYAFENNLISETMRVILGLFAGLVFLAAGEFVIKRFPTYGQIVSGTGLGMLYLSLYAAFNVYEILPQSVAFLGMIIVTAIGVFLAVMHNAPPLAGFAQMGGLITPLLLSSGHNNPHALFIYLAILNVGILAIARWKLWRFLNFTSFAGTALIYFLWFIKYYTPDQFWIAEGYASLFFVIFLVLSLSSYFIQKTKQDEIDLTFTTLNPILYFLISLYMITNSVFLEWKGLFTVVLALLYLILAFSLKKQEQEIFRYQQFLLGIGFVFAVLAVPIQFDKIWVTIGWSAEALVFTFLGFQVRSKILRIFSQSIFLMVIFRLLNFDRILALGSEPWLNERFFAFMVSILCLIGTAFLYNYKKSEVSGEENGIFSLLLVESGIIFLSAGSFEIMSFFPKWLLSVFWSMGAVIIFAIAFSLKNFPARIFAVVVLAAAAIRLILIDSRLGLDAESWLNSRFYVSLVVLLATGTLLFIYNNFRNRLEADKEDEYKIFSSGFLIGIYALSLWTISSEIGDFHPAFWLPIYWSLAAVLGCILSFAQKNNPLRFTVYATLVLIFFRLIVHENRIFSFNQYSPVLNTRFLAFIVGAVAFGIILLLLKKNKENLLNGELRIIRPSLFLGMNFLLFWLLSSEIIDYFRARLSHLSSLEKRAQLKHFENLRNTALSVGWTLYAIILLIIGIFKKSIFSRFLAIFLLGIVIFKVFLIDTANLNNFYRFISFITLGLILLLTGFLYYRYRSRIVQFIKGEDSGGNIA